MPRGSAGSVGLRARNGRAARLAVFLAAVVTSTLQASHAGTVATYYYNDRVFGSARVCIVGNIACQMGCSTAMYKVCRGYCPTDCHGYAMTPDAQGTT